MITGLNTNDAVVAFSGALLVAAMAGLVALALGLLTRALTPLPLRQRRAAQALASAVGVRWPLPAAAAANT